MFAFLRALVLPLLFVLPWVVIKLVDPNNTIQDKITSQPILVILLLLPGIIVSQITKMLRR